MKYKLFNGPDILIVPLILLVLVMVLFAMKKKQPVAIQKYLFSGFWLRVAGTLLISALIEFYYTYGDTYYYYYNAQLLKSFMFTDPGAWFDVMFSNPEKGGDSVVKYLDYVGTFNDYSVNFFRNNENATVCKIGSLINLVCFDSSLAIALVFGLLSFLGCWYVFKTFVHFFPGYEKQFSRFCIFLPSLWFWGSGILKDPLCLFAMGLLVFNLFVKTGSRFRRIFAVCTGAFLLLNIKPYILYSIVIAVIMGWVFFRFRRFNIISKILSIISVIALLIASYALITDFITQTFDNILLQSQSFIKNYEQISQEGDGGFIPTLDPSPAGLAKLAGQGLVNVFMRPFPWEVNKILYIFLIIENLLIYYIIIKKVPQGPLDFHRNHRMLINFSLVFFIFLGLVVGVTTFNFGTIARYRVPALPFLFAGIFALKLGKKSKRHLNLIPAPG